MATNASQFRYFYIMLSAMITLYFVDAYPHQYPRPPRMLVGSDTSLANTKIVQSERKCKLHFSEEQPIYWIAENVDVFLRRRRLSNKKRDIPEGMSPKIYWFIIDYLLSA